MKERGPALLALSAAPLLAVLSPTAAGPLAPLLRAVCVAAWVCTGWLCLIAVLEHGAQLPGRLGRLADGLVRRVAPASVRGLVRMAVGTSLAASVLTGPAALAEDRTPMVAGSVSDSLEWPGLAPVTAAPAVTGAPPVAAAPHVTVAPPTSSPTPTADPRPSAVPLAHLHEVVVQEGDSLWAIAQRALGPSASDQQVAKAWPQWWAANRAVVGDHPDLIHPGDRLSAP